MKNFRICPSFCILGRGSIIESTQDPNTRVKIKEENTMKKKQLMAGVMAAGMAMSLAACGGSTSTAASATESTAASTSAASAAEGDITLRFAWWGGDERANATLEVIKQFEAANPNIHIEAEYGSSDGYHEQAGHPAGLRHRCRHRTDRPRDDARLCCHRRLLPQLHGLRL